MKWRLWAFLYEFCWFVSEDWILDRTEGEYEHPEWWDFPCLCYECKSSG